eukprot:87281-Rhodomonas_salina.3
MSTGQGVSAYGRRVPDRAYQHTVGDYRGGGRGGVGREDLAVGHLEQVEVAHQPQRLHRLRERVRAGSAACL